MQPRLIVQQELTTFVNKYNVYDAKADSTKGQLVGMAQQKRLAFKERVLFYTDEKRDRVAFVSRAEKVIDVDSRYFVEDGSGKLVGMFKKDVTALFLKSTWKILDANGSERYVVRESNRALAIMRRPFSGVPLLGALIDAVVLLLRYHFEFVDLQTHQIVGVYTKTTVFRDHYLLSVEQSLWDGADWRVLASIGVALDALQSR